MPVNLIKEWLGHRTGRLALALGIYALLFILWVAFGAARLPYREAIGDLAFPPLGIIAAVLTWRLGSQRSLKPRARFAWRTIALAMFSYAVGDLLWAYYELVLGTSPFPSLADDGYLLFYPLFMVGLVSFPCAPQTKGQQTKFWLDAGTVLLGGWMVIWYFVLGPLAVAEHADRLRTLLSSAYPIGDLVLLFGTAAMLLRHPEGGNRYALGFLAAGIISFLVADVGFGYQDLKDMYQSGNWPDAFWMLAWFLFAASALYQGWWVSQKAATDTPAVEEMRAVSSLPYAAVTLGFALLIIAGGHAAPYPLGGLLYAAIAMTAFVLIRQLTVMTENLQLLADLRQLATTDSLTGLLNRREFFSLAEREFERFQRYRRLLAAIMLDIDTFKTINDRHGHQAGDLVIQTVAEHCRKQLRKVDLAARYGGDEVVILLPETDLHGASGVAQRLLEAIQQSPLAFGEHLLKISISAGVAAGNGTSSLAALLHRADQALYEAKQAGRNRIKINAER